MSEPTPSSPSAPADGAAVVPPCVPLYVFPFSDGYKIGIKVSFDGGTTFHMFEFDTGGTGFWAAYDSTWWPNAKAVGPQLNIQYSSGIQYTANPVDAQITLENQSLPAISAVVGQIVQASKTTGNNQFTPQQWEHDVQTGQPPLYGNFWGDFGVALGSGNIPLLAVLPQIGGGLANGFIVDLGPYPKNVGPSNSWVQQGSLQIGLTADQIAAFTTQISMQGLNPSVPNPLYPNSGLPTYTELLGQGTLQLTKQSVEPAFSAPTGVVFDTGAPTAEIHFGTVFTPNQLEPYQASPTDNSDLANNVQFNLTIPGAASSPAWTLSFPTGSKSGKNEVGTTTVDVNNAHPTGYLNTGLIPFFGNRVMFNVAGGTIGFAPANN